jgi:hypothetical protein
MTGTTHSIAELVIRLGARPSGKPPTLSAAFLPSIILMTRPLKIVLTLKRECAVISVFVPRNEVPRPDSCHGNRICRELAERFLAGDESAQFVRAQMRNERTSFCNGWNS